MNRLGGRIVCERRPYSHNMGFRTTGIGVVLCILAAGSGTFARQRGVGPGPTPPQGGAAGAAPVAIGTIVGRVVDAATGQPVPDAQVSAQLRGASMVGGGPGPNSVRLLTGSDGRFVVRDLPAGNVSINVQAPGYLNGNFGQTAPGTGGGRPIVISPENRVQEAVVRLWKHAAVSGLVTDEGNEPAIRVAVRAFRRTFANGRPQLSAAGAGQTDDRGVYRIAPLTPGDYLIVVPQTQTTMPAAVIDSVLSSVMGGDLSGLMDMAAAGLGAEMAGRGGDIGLRVGDHLLTSASGAGPVMSGDGRMAAYVTQFYPAAATAAEASVITLGSGETRAGIDIRMPLVPTVHISGVVTGPDGPVGNLAVRLLPLNDNGADSGGVTEIARATTAADGSFLMLGVPAGSYVAKVLKTPRPTMPPGFANLPQMQALMGGGSAPAKPSDSLTLFADIPVSAERNVDGLVVALASGATVSGRVEFVGSATQPPLTGFTVSLQSATGATLAVSPARVGDDATFATPGYPAGQYFVSATGRLSGWFVKSAMVNGVDALEQPFTLTAENIGNVVVTVVDRQTGISGSVTGATGAPAEGTVILFPSNYREWIARGMPQRLTRNIRSQAKGAYTITGVPARDYLIVAVSDEALPDLQNPAVYEALARAATAVTLSEGETRTMSIKLTQVVR
jgi:hypothetical protein